MARAPYPIDPWGNPYLFFGSGRMGQVGGPNAVLNNDCMNIIFFKSIGSTFNLLVGRQLCKFHVGN
jgi:hypothetical protein